MSADAQEWLCGGVDGGEFFYTNPVYDFAPCYQDLFLFGISFVYIILCGTSHLVGDVKVQKRTFFEMRTIELIIFVLSGVLVVFPLAHLVVLYVAEPDKVAGWLYLSVAMRSAGWLWSIVIFYIEISRCLFSPSYTMYGFWALSTLGSISRLRTSIQTALDGENDLDHGLWYGESIVIIANFAIAAFALRRTDGDERPKGYKGGMRSPLLSPVANGGRTGIAALNSDGLKYDIADDRDASTQPSLEAAASLISILTFNWMSPLFVAGYRDQLKFTDFWGLQYFDKTRYIGMKFDAQWKKQEERAELKLPEGKCNTWSLIWTLSGAFGKPFYIAGVLKLISDVLIFVQPQLLSLMIQFVMGNDPDWYGYAYATGMFITGVTMTSLLHQYFHKCFRVGMWLKSSLVSSVYKKSLRLSGSARQEKTTGEIVNLMSTDAQRIQDLFPYLHMLWSAPLQITLSVYFLWEEVGVSVLVGLGVMLTLMIPINLQVVRKLVVVQKALMKIKDVRLKVTNEVLASMKVIKLYAWENSFDKKITDVRNTELGQLRKYVILHSIINTVWNSTPSLVALATFGTFVLMGNELTADRAFTALALFNIIRFPLTMLPMVINQMVESTVSLERLTNFLTANELHPHDQDQTILKPGEDVVMEDATFYWDDEGKSVALNKINMRIKRGELAMIVGQTGSGKTAMLNALIGDLNKASGRVAVQGDVAYTAQVAWIQNASLRDNILYGSDYDRKWYKKVVHACALEPDIETLPGGDETEIGEKGINLSGGQKQRVALARAVYKRYDIYFLDDTLSAVDAHVGQHIMKHCILGLLGDKTRVFGTNSVHFLKDADNIIVLEKGEVTHQGSYSELLAGDFDLEALLKVDKPEEEEEKEGDLQSLVAPLSPGMERQRSERSGSVGSLKSQKSKTSKITRTPGTPGSPGTPGKDEIAMKIGGQLIVIENRARGAVSGRVYWSYILAAGGTCVLFSILFSMLMRQAADVGTQRWLAIWSDAVGDGDADDKIGLYLGVYGALNVATILFVIVNLIVIYFGRIRASKILHEDVLTSMLRAPMAFFDTTPIGRILNRFASDMYMVDNSLPQILFSYLGCLFQVFATLGVIAVITPFFMVALIPLGAIYWFTQNYYITTSRDLKRWSSVLQSPIYQHFSECLDGVSTIRAFSAQRRFTMSNEEKVNNWELAYYPSIAANRWLAVRLEFVGVIVVFLASVFAVTSRYTISGGLAGMSISYALNVTQTLNWLVRMTADRENQVVAVERVQEYTDTPSEAPLESKPEHRPDDDWPAQGQIEFRDYKMKYRPELELVLRGLTAVIKPREKVGVVGRTGAGKSSLFNAMLRVIEAADGSIVIDGVDIGKIGLHDLRSKLTIIPQDPVLFTGTVRFNLDPFNVCTDDEIWRALKLAHIEEHIRPLRTEKDDGTVLTDLDYEVAEGGSNLSAGQRQLLCMSRALLRKSNILLLDEATSAVDVQTDRLVQATIREAFVDYTVLTIAHRLETIMDSERIMVMEDGKIIEFDSPQKLLDDPKSAFSSVVKAAFGDS